MQLTNRTEEIGFVVSDLSKLSAQTFNLLGTRYADEGNYVEALRYFNRAIEIDPDNATAYFNKGTVKVKLGDLTGSKNDFLKAFTLRHDA
jgi:tetratricopeptide (TPR) repeat protein